MPYALRGNCVYKGQEKLKCYDNRADALAYFRALEVNVRESQSPIKELSLYISKVSVDKANGGRMNWRAVASDTSPDLYAERMSNELYDDFISRINNNAKVPAPFDKALGEDWNGGMPYLSISHYKSGTGSRNVPGMPDKIYRDGDKLKAIGYLHDNDMGRAVFKSLCDDLYSEKAKTEGKIRISIGFLDLEHKHLGKGSQPDFVFERKSLEDVCPMCQSGLGEKVYTKGQLVHLALTRVPVNPRTDMEVNKAMPIETKRQDAESIIGKELSDTLEEKSLTSSALVIKSNDENTTGADVKEKADLRLGLPGQEPGTGLPIGGGSPVNPTLKPLMVVDDGKTPDIDDDDEDDMPKKDMRPVAKAKIAADKKDEEKVYEEDDETKREERRNRPAGERSLLQKSFDNIEAKVMEMKALNVPAETALKDIQPLFNDFGEQIKKSLQPELTQSQPNNEVSELMNIVKSLAETVQVMQQTMTTELATLKAQTLSIKSSTAGNGVPVPRSLSAQNLPAQKSARPLTQLEQLAFRSTGAIS